MAHFTGACTEQPAGIIILVEITRRRGWSLDDEERYAGMCCLAAPVSRAASFPFGV